MKKPCLTCVATEMKLKDALGRVKHMEEIVKQDEVFSCSNCRKQKGLLDACKNCANLTQEVSYLKSSLQRFSDGKKKLNMILDQSRVSTHNRALGFNPYAHHTRHPPVVLGAGARGGEILLKPEPKNTVFKSAGIMTSLSASSSKTNVMRAKPSVSACVAKPYVSIIASNHHDKYTCSFCGNCFCEKEMAKTAFCPETGSQTGALPPVRPAVSLRSDRRYLSGQTGLG